MKNMNTLNFKKLKSIIEIIKSNNINDEDTFDFFRTLNMKNNYDETLAKNQLFFFNYANEKDIIDGWIDEIFDYRKYIDNIINTRKNATFVIEPHMEEKFQNKNLKYIVVENIPKSIDELYYYYLNKSKAITIGVTGTVGKTTCVGLIENVLKRKYKVLRLYSKRITPHILKMFIINSLTDDVDIITLEMSIFYKEHVKILSELLPPTIASILNIKEDHLNEGGLNNLEDILIYKAQILKNAEHLILNYDDNLINKLSLENHKIKYKNKIITTTNADNITEINSKDFLMFDEYFIIKGNKIKPFINTKLTYIQYLITYKIAELLNVEEKDILEGLNTYTPVENRIGRKVAFNKKIIFDGDITGYERLKELSNNFYDKVYLVLRKVGSSEEIGNVLKIGELFNKFDKVYIFKDVEYLKYYKNYQNVLLVDNHDFMKNIDGTIIYHYSGYYRVWDEFNENNLNIYDNEIYKIKRCD